MKHYKALALICTFATATAIANSFNPAVAKKTRQPAFPAAPASEFEKVPHPHSEVEAIELAVKAERAGEVLVSQKLFAKASKFDPSDWKGWIGQAQELYAMGRIEEALVVLGEMVTHESSNFEWYRQRTLTFLAMGQNQLAVDSAIKSTSLAKTEEQKATAYSDLLLAYLRNNDIAKANEIKQNVFATTTYKTAQLYLRAVTELAPPQSPDNAAEILRSAKANLSAQGDSEAFYSLARSFEQKASLVSYDKQKSGKWAELEEIAYRRAIDLNPKVAAYRVGLVYALALAHKDSELISQLSELQTLDDRDQLAGYLLSKLKPIQVASADTSSSPSVPAAVAPSQISLTEAKIGISGINCGCKLSIIANSFRQIKGIVFTTTSKKVPYSATILVDPKMISMSEAQAQMESKKPLPELKYEVLSTKSIEGVADALKVHADERRVEGRLLISEMQLVDQ